MTQDEESTGFSATERAAMKQRAEELRAAREGEKGSARRARELQACLDAISALDGSDRQIAERFHEIVWEVAPELDPKTWYGFPSYARDGKVVVFCSRHPSLTPGTPPSVSTMSLLWTRACSGRRRSLYWR